jgi:hypothetical protein
MIDYYQKRWNFRQCVSETILEYEDMGDDLTAAVIGKTLEQFDKLFSSKEPKDFDRRIVAFDKYLGIYECAASDEIKEWFGVFWGDDDPKNRNLRLTTIITDKREDDA